MVLEENVSAHYTTGGLTDRVRGALKELGVDPDAATAEDLKACDEFHTGGVQSSDALLEFLTITPETRVLDIGCGIGGPARLLASRYGCRSTGVDLTQEFVDTAKDLSAMVGLSDQTSFLQGSGLDLPVEDSSAHLALLLHVGMNIEDKAGLFAEAHRALSPGGIFAVFDVMRGADDSTGLVFPLPWSSVAKTSFVVPPGAYKDAATATGFTLIHERDRAEFAKDFFAEVFESVARDGPPKLGIHLMMGDTAGAKIQNYVKNLDAGRITPVELIFRKNA
ncbi:MAG: methyltransferase domain-containing protein [Pseudomonadota bacterium]